MKFFILGNINSGKSSFAKNIQLYLKNKGLEYPILSIDDFRIKYGNGSQKRENIAQHKFYLSIKETKNAIIEMVGFGNIGTKVIKSLDKNSCVVIYIQSSLKTCLNRLNIKKKILKNIPYPESINNIEQTIQNLNVYFRLGKLQEKWNNVSIKFYQIDTKQINIEIIKGLPLEHYHYLDAVINLFKSLNYKKLIAFGGLGRCDINTFSDLDLILITNKEIISVYESLKNFFKSQKNLNFQIYILDEKIIIKFNKHILIEIAVIRKFSEYIQFYYGSNIKNISKSILIGDKKLEENIKSSLKYYMPNTINHSKCRKKLDYYIELLQKASLNNDNFRFYFMNNLIVNQIVRILCLRENITDFIYCPKNINTLIKKYNVQSILWDMTTDKENHIDKIFNFLKKIGINS